MGNKSIKQNYLFNLVYKIFAIITPLITAPYISRVLEPDGVGIYSYALSIISYFCIFAIMGTSIYGQREISYVQNDAYKRSVVFWNVVSFRTLMTIITVCAYISFVFLNRLNESIYLSLLLNIIAVAFDISWFFQGMEEFRKIAIRDIFFKLIGIIGIFGLVKDKSDLPIYILLMCAITLISAISFWGFVPRFIKKISFKELRPLKDFNVIFSLFIPTIAIQVYTVLDKTMIGFITANNFENGYYEQAIKIATFILTIVTAMGTVMIPRIGNLYAQGKQKEVIEYMYRGYRFVWFIGIPLCFGLIGVSDNFVPWFFGPGYEQVSILLKITAFIVLAVGINNVTGMQYLIPLGKQNLFTKTVVVGAVSNFILNLVLIPFIGSVGAAIASVFAESIIAIIQIIYVRNELNWKVILKSGWKYLVSGICMFSVLFIENSVFDPSVLNTVIMTFTGAGIYFFALFIIRDEFFLRYSDQVIRRIRQR